MSANTIDPNELGERWPDWHSWCAVRADETPGDLMATRRRALAEREIRAGLAMTLPYGVTGTLPDQLARQDEIERDLDGGASA